MVVIELPEFDVDHIEVFIAEEVRISVDVRFSIDVHETFEYLRVFKFPLLIASSTEITICLYLGIPIFSFTETIFMEQIYKKKPIKPTSTY